MLDKSVQIMITIVMLRKLITHVQSVLFYNNSIVNLMSIAKYSQRYIELTLENNETNVTNVLDNSMTHKLH